MVEHLRFLHIAAAVLLLGNVVVTGFWALYLYRSGHASTFRPVARAILWADLLFTTIGGATLTITGILLIQARGYPWRETRWILEGIGSLGVATLIWLVFLLPDQWRMERLAPGDDAGLRRLFLRWSMLGWLATAVLFYGLWAMVGKR
jgi:uncharacterized membrane protein